MNDNTNLKLLTKTRDEAIKASKNIVKAIEQGIITEMTISRLAELESEISRLDFEIEKEKQKSYTFLTIEEIETYLQSKVFSDTEDIKIRKLLVNTFIREIILYPDKLVITYNFINPIENNTINPTTIREKEKQIDSALSSNKGSYIQLPVAPETKNTNPSMFVFFVQLLTKKETFQASLSSFKHSSFVIKICLIIPSSSFDMYPNSSSLSIIFAALG